MEGDGVRVGSLGLTLHRVVQKGEGRGEGGPVDPDEGLLRDVAPGQPSGVRELTGLPRDLVLELGDDEGLGHRHGKLLGFLAEAQLQVHHAEVGLPVQRPWGLEGLVLRPKGVQHPAHLRGRGVLPPEERGPEELRQNHGAEVLGLDLAPAVEALGGLHKGPDVGGDPLGVRHVLEHDLAVPQAVGAKPELEQLQDPRLVVNVVVHLGGKERERCFVRLKRRWRTLLA